MAHVLSYVRSSFGNQASKLDPEIVKSVRNATADRSGLWTEAELKR
jgi:hypothetical protein